MTILVVGGAGYIGSHTCKALQKAGFVPVVYDNLSNGHAWAASYGPLVVGDLLDTSLLNHTLKKYRPQAVLHFASSINCRASGKEPALYYQNNVMGSLLLLDALQKNDIQLLVFSSTAAVYGHPTTHTLDEKSPCAPVNVYGKTKWMVEEMIHDFEKAYGLKAVILRYFNAAGADPEGELGEAHRPETHLIPLALSVAGGRLPFLNVFGDGTALRDYIHVTDLADAHVQALKWLLTEQTSITFNLGTGKGHSLLEVIKMVEQITQKPVATVMKERLTEEPAVLVADAALAREQLNWSPSWSNLETIVQTAYNWHSKELS